MSKETDKKLSVLYLARSEGKAIQTTDALGRWFDLSITCTPLHYSHRIRPQTAGEAITEWLENNIRWSCSTTKDEAYTFGFENALIWRDENPKDQDNE